MEDLASQFILLYSHSDSCGGDDDAQEEAGNRVLPELAVSPNFPPVMRSVRISFNIAHSACSMHCTTGLKWRQLVLQSCWLDRERNCSTHVQRPYVTRRRRRRESGTFVMYFGWDYCSDSMNDDMRNGPPCIYNVGRNVVRKVPEKSLNNLLGKQTQKL